MPDFGIRSNAARLIDVSRLVHEVIATFARRHAALTSLLDSFMEEEFSSRLKENGYIHKNGPILYVEQVVA